MERNGSFEMRGNSIEIRGGDRLGDVARRPLSATLGEC